MSRYQSYGGGMSFGPRMSPAARMLMIVCCAAFGLQLIDRLAAGASFTYKLGLNPFSVTHQFYVWQLVTYIFLHGGFMHLLFNMLALWMFGAQLEQVWGTREFLRFFFICGVGAAIVTVLVSPNSATVTIGASGAILGLLVAFGVLFPNQVILLNFFIPIPAKYYVMIFGAMTFFAAVSGAGGGVAYVTHLGGMAIGFAYLKSGRITAQLKWRYDRWRRNRLRRKFDVYYNERHQNDQEKWRRWKN